MLVLEEDVFGLGHGLLDIMTFTDIHNFGLEVLTSFSWEEAFRRRNLNRCVFNFFPAGCRARILVEKKKTGSPNCRYKECDSRVWDWYKKLVRGTKVLFGVFVVRPCWILKISKGVVFIYRFPTHLGPEFGLEEGRERGQEGRYVCCGVDVVTARRV